MFIRALRTSERPLCSPHGYGIVHSSLRAQLVGRWRAAGLMERTLHRAQRGPPPHRFATGRNDADGGKGKVGGFPPSASRKEHVTPKLTGIIHVEFDRAGSGLPAHDFLPFEVDVAVDLVVAEYVSPRQEGAVVLERDQRLTERSAHGRDVDQLLRRKVDSY